MTIWALRRPLETKPFSGAQLKAQVDRTEDKLPLSPTACRAAEQKAPLGAAESGGFYKPSHKVLEKVNEFFELDELRFEPWSFYNHRDSEIRGQSAVLGSSCSQMSQPCN